ncbi:LemA family protein [Candidatus Margulisiibacteriota bacterium]
MNYILIGLLLVLVIFVILIYNRIIKLKHMLNEAWSGVDVQLKRRHDLIPNILESVKAYSNYEKDLFTKIADIRSGFSKNSGIKETGEKENVFTGALKSVFALAEAYPDLKANNNFLNLQKTLTEIENELQLARRYYNGTVRNYNIAIQTFPGMLVAGPAKFVPEEFFEIELASERQVPHV